MDMTVKTGEMGVALVIVELLARGFSPYRPVVDDHGVDIMLLNGNRIQVKSAKLTGKKTGKQWYTRYRFSLNKFAWTKIEQGSTKARDVADDADFVILVGIDQRRFWIVPSSILRGRIQIEIAESAKWIIKGSSQHFKERLRDSEGDWRALMEFHTMRGGFIQVPGIGGNKFLENLLVTERKPC